MSILRNVLGPRSKYDHRLPYTYEARVMVTGVEGMTESYVSDTLCALTIATGSWSVYPLPHRMTFTRDIEIASDGSVNVDSQPVAKLRVVEFEDPHMLERQGQSRRRVDAHPGE